jgi:hypothetical protein
MVRVSIVSRKIVVKRLRDIFTPFCVLALGIGIPCILAMRGQAFSTNDLWLQIARTNNAAALTIHAPATNANGVYDLYFNTNLIAAQDWTWLLRNAPGQTNLAVSNLPPVQGFFRLQTHNTIRTGFYQFSLPREDDSPSSNAIIPFTINFYGATYSNAWVNNNGNVTFDKPQSAYTPSVLNSLHIRIIAPFWADVDTDDSGSDVVKYGTNLVNGHAAFGANWVNVGYYNAHSDKLLSCQLVIINRSDIVPGDFDMEFNYDQVQWEWGDFSVGNPPRAGFSDGTVDYELQGSGVEGAFMDTNVLTGLIYRNLNSSVPGRYFFTFRNGQPAP